MSINETILELAEELVDPEETVLDDQLEKEIEAEEDQMLGVGDDDDELIDFIDKGKRLTNSDPINFTDDDVDETIEDDDDEY